MATPTMGPTITPTLLPVDQEEKPDPSGSEEEEPMLLSLEVSEEEDPMLLSLEVSSVEEGVAVAEGAVPPTAPWTEVAEA